MNSSEFEQRVLHLWATTRIPLTRANLQLYSHAPRKKLVRWLDQLVGDGVLDIDADDEGEMVWTVPGAKRPLQGPETLAELERLERLGEPTSLDGVLWLATSGRSSLTARRRAGRPAKSVAASGVLSFFFGPFGWLYAAPWKEAVPAILVYLLLLAFTHLPLLGLLFGPILFLVHALCGLAGVGYAWRHNQQGERTPLLPPVRR